MKADRCWWPVLAIVALGVGVRVAVAIIFPAQVFYIDDSDTYLAAAANILNGHTIGSILVMPGYPLLLALVGGTPLAGLVTNILLAAVGIWLLVDLAQTITGDKVAGLLAGIVWAVYPFAIFYAVAGLSETLFVTLLLAGFLSYYRGAFTFGSFIMVLAILTRPFVEVLTPILIVTFALVVHRQTLTRALRHCGYFLAIYLVLMAPWWLHNYAKYGTFVRLNLGFGVVLYAGNNPMNVTAGVEDGVDYDLSRFNKISDPVLWDRAIKDAAIQFIKDNPRRFLDLSILKFEKFWAVSSGHRYVVVSLLSYLPIAILALFGFVKLLPARWRLLSPIVLLIGYTTVVHMVTIGTLRYRFPLEPFLIILASCPLTLLFGLIRSGKMHVADVPGLVRGS